MFTTDARRSISAVTPTILLVGLSWGLIVVALATGQQDVIDHDVIFERVALPTPVTLLLFLLAWQVMTASMMLPSSMPMMVLFARASEGQERPNLVRGAFLAAYFFVWTGFALAALIFDAGIHALVAHSAWLNAHQNVIAGSLFILAGMFQFSPLKEQCLNACRSPLSFIWQHYQRGVLAAWRLGVRHGLFCLGCCWALMLVMFGVGVGSWFWLVVLTGIMTIEKTTRWGRSLVPYVGIALLALGLTTVADPALLGSLISN